MISLDDLEASNKWFMGFFLCWVNFVNCVFFVVFVVFVVFINFVEDGSLLGLSLACSNLSAQSPVLANLNNVKSVSLYSLCGCSDGCPVGLYGFNGGGAGGNGLACFFKGEIINSV